MLELLIEMTTCKLIFPVGSITQDQLGDLLQKYTPHYTIVNFYPEREVGCNTITFAVVDVPQKVIQLLANETTIRDIDLMSHYQTKRPSGQRIVVLLALLVADTPNLNSQFVDIKMLIKEIEEGGYYQLPDGRVCYVRILHCGPFGSPHPVLLDVYDKNGLLVRANKLTYIHYLYQCVRRVKPK